MGKRGDARRIMCPVEQHKRHIPQPLKPAGHARTRHTAHLGLNRDVPASRAQRRNRAVRGIGVLQLVAAGHRDGKALPAAHIGRALDITAQHLHVLAAVKPNGACRVARAADGRQRFVRLAVRTHNRAGGLDDRSLLARDLRDRVAQHRHVVERDRRQNAHLGRADDIGRIVSAAKAGLQYNDIASLRGKIQKRHRSGELKLTDVLPFGE